MKTSQIAALALATLAAGSAQAQLFKCVTPQGRTVYQDAPCEDTSRQSTVRAPAPGAPPPAAPSKDAPKGAAPAAAAAAPSGGSVADTVALYMACTEKVPNFLRRNADAYEGWKQRNSGAIDRLSSEPDASRLDARLREERDRPAEGMPDRCAGVATTIQAPRDAGAPIVTGGPATK